MALNESSTTVPTFELAASLVSFSLLTLVATPANGFLVAAFVYNRRLRSVTNMLVIGLACADLLVGLLAIPCWMSILVKRYYHAMDVFSYQFYITLDIFIGSAAILQLTSISLERCHAVMKPIKHRLLPKTKFYGVLATAWVGAALLAALQPVQYHRWQKVYTALVTTVCFVIPSVVITIAYIKVFATTRSSSRHVQRNARKTQLAREARLSLTVVMITLLFVVTWLPLFALTTIETYTPKNSPHSSPLVMFVKWMHYSSSAVNPFLYAFRNNDVKTTIRIMLCRFFLKKGPSLRELSYSSGSLRSSRLSVKRPSMSSESGRRRSTFSDGNNNPG